VLDTIIECLSNHDYDTTPLEYLRKIHYNRDVAESMRNHARYHAHGNLHRHSEGEIVAKMEGADEIDAGADKALAECKQRWHGGSDAADGNEDDEPALVPTKKYDYWNLDHPVIEKRR